MSPEDKALIAEAREWFRRHKHYPKDNFIPSLCDLAEKQALEIQALRAWQQDDAWRRRVLEAEAKLEKQARVVEAAREASTSTLDWEIHLEAALAELDEKQNKGR